MTRVLEYAFILLECLGFLLTLDTIIFYALLIQISAQLKYYLRFLHDCLLTLKSIFSPKN